MNQGLVGFEGAKPSKQAVSGQANKTGQASQGQIADVTEANFMELVMEASTQKPVIVQFHAHWCGPCKQLSPILERAVAALKGAVKLVKLDIDHSPNLAAQLQIQSVPMVYAFFQGRPAHGFAGAQPESKIKAFLQELLQMTGVAMPDDALDEEAALAQMDDLIAAGQLVDAVNLAGQLLIEFPECLSVRLKAVMACFSLQAWDSAEKLLDQAPADQKDNDEWQQAQKRLQSKQAAQGEAGNITNLQTKIQADPKDFEARMELATLLAAQDEFMDAMAQCLYIIEAEPQWQEERARHYLLELFETAGVTHPATKEARRKLSSLLFR